MVNNRRRYNYAIYEKEGLINTGQKEYCVLCRNNGKMDLWGQINTQSNADYYSIEIRYPGGQIGYAEKYNVTDKRKVRFIRTIGFQNRQQQIVGTLSFINGKKAEHHVQIVDCCGKQVFVEPIKSTGALELEFSDDDQYDDKVSPWYFRRFDDPLMAAMVMDEGAANAKDKFKERYGVVLPGDIPDQMVAVLLALPFVY